MKYDKYDTLGVMMKRYSIEILKAVRNKPLRFTDLRIRIVSNPKTLSISIGRLIEYGLIESTPVKTGSKYSNFYIISYKGRHMLEKVEKL